jgi:AcrR family transcriptional regulator
MPAEDKKPYHHGDLREALLTAAEQALADSRLKDVSLREIARRAGVSHAAPAHHFGSLGALLAEVAARGFERFVAALDEAAARGSDQSPAARMQAMARAYLGFAAAHPAVYGLMFGKRENVLEPTPHFMTAMLAAWTQLEEQVGAVVGPQRKLHGAAAVWSAVHGLAMLRLDHKLPPHIDPQAAVEAVSRIIVAGLQGEAGG